MLGRNDTRNKTVDRRILRLFAKQQYHFKKDFWLSYFIPLQVICLSTLFPLYTGKTLAALGSQEPNPGRYIPILIGIAVAGIIFNYIGFTHMMYLQAKVIDRLRKSSFLHLLNRSVGFHNNNISGKLVTDVMDYASAYSQLGNAYYTTFLPFIVGVVSGIFVVMINSLLLGLLLLGMTTVVVGSAMYYSKVRAPLRMERHEARRVTVGHLADTIVNSPTVKTFAHEDMEMAEHARLSNHFLGLVLRDWRLVGVDGNRRIIMLLAFELTCIALIIHQVTRDPALLGIGIFAFTYIIQLTNRLFDVTTLIRTYDEAITMAQPMADFLRQPAEILDTPEAADLAVKNGAIALRDVKFQYEDGSNSKQVFKKLNIAIKPGEKVGLVGPSGGGKSTLTRLLLRFEDIQGGSISIDGQDIAKVTQKSLRSNISYVPQEPLLFHRTVKENIGYGDLNATDKVIKHAAKLANADEFIDELPRKYDTIVGERGVKLSGGQRQRVAIARAILKNAPLLVLDEATSALDSENEVLIQGALWNLMEGKTAIVIAHRLSTVQKLDRILVMKDGQVIEEGSHKELTKKKGLYNDLWNHQSGGFIDE